MAQTNLLHLLAKRQHVYAYDTENIPEKQLIEDILWKAWKVTPSKNNFMPYHVNVLGPDKRKEKNKIWMKSYDYKKFKTSATIDGKLKPHVQRYIIREIGRNPYFKHIISAPYLLVFTQRVCEPNAYHRKTVEKGDNYEQMHESELYTILDTTALEVGMWMANLSAFALEKGLNTSVIKCYPNHEIDWSEFPWIKHFVICIATIGKAKTLRREVMTDVEKKDDKKPEPEEIIKWI